MEKFYLLFLLTLVNSLGFAQEVEKVETVSDRFHYQYLKQETKPTQEQIKKDNEERQRNWQEDLEQMRAGLVSDNVKIEVQTEVRGNDLVVAVAYETLVVADAADDYGLGKYAVENSNACMLMCNFLKEKMETDLIDLLKPGAKVDVKITGATDGTPIRSKIDYKGEYGDFNNKAITLNGNPYQMTVTQKEGVTTNGQLAFLRTQGVEHFLKTKVEPLKHTHNTFEEYAVENKEKGGGYRRVSVEMTICSAFADVEPQKVKKP